MISSMVVSVVPADNEVTFSVGASTGELRANGTLDRETTSRYIITVNVSYGSIIRITTTYLVSGRHLQAVLPPVLVRVL